MIEINSIYFEQRLNASKDWILSIVTNRNSVVTYSHSATSVMHALDSMSFLAQQAATAIADDVLHHTKMQPK